MTAEQYTEFKDLRSKYWDKFTTKCPHCKTKIIKTSTNKEGKCPFRLCKGYGYISKGNQDNNIKEQYLGHSKYSILMGDIVHCIDIIDENKLVCVNVGYPKVLILSQEEFNSLK